MNKFNGQTQSRMNDHMKIADYITKDFKRETENQSNVLGNKSQQYIDDDTGLLYGLGFDVFIHKINRDKQEILSIQHLELSEEKD